MWMGRCVNRRVVGEHVDVGRKTDVVEGGPKWLAVNSNTLNSYGTLRYILSGNTAVNSNAINKNVLYYLFIMESPLLC